jgi:hypothetical protein
MPSQLSARPRSRFDRLVRSNGDLIESLAPHLAALLLDARKRPYEALHRARRCLSPRRAKRRGHGWLAGSADIGRSNSLGWYEGSRLLVAAVDPTGVITGFCFSGLLAPPTSKWRELSQRPQGLSEPQAAGERRVRLPRAALLLCVVEKGFEGAERTTGDGSRALRGEGHLLPAQTQRPRGVAQALEALGSRNPPDHRDRLMRSCSMPPSSGRSDLTS